MPENLPIHPKLMKLYLAAKKLAKQKAELARMKIALANWPTKKTAGESVSATPPT